MTGEIESSLNSWDGMMSWVRSLESVWVIWVWTHESEKDEGHPVERDRTTDVARQHDTGRSQDDGEKNRY